MKKVSTYLIYVVSAIVLSLSTYVILFSIYLGFNDLKFACSPNSGWSGINCFGFMVYMPLAVLVLTPTYFLLLRRMVHEK